MLHLALLTLFVVSPGETEAEVDRQQLTRILDATWARIKDFEFVFEGNIAPRDRSSKPDPLRPGKTTNPDDFAFHYQGTFAWRSDGSIHLENYVQNVNPERPLSHQITNLFRGSIGKRNRVPDHNPAAGPGSGFAGNVLSMNRSMSPVRFIQYPILRVLIHAYDWHYKFQRWETISGRRLLVIDLANRPYPYPSATMVKRFWLDMERGAMPLKVEFFFGPDLESRVSDIDLSPVRSRDGMQVWVPVRGTCHSFVEEMMRHFKDPVFEETYAVLGGTIRVNQGLPDSRFGLDYTAKPASEGLVRAKAIFDGAATAWRGKQESPQRRIDRALAEADRQSEQLRASMPSKESWLWRNPLSSACLALGLMTLTLAVFWRWRARR